jgi:hypothetical protein
VPVRAHVPLANLAPDLVCLPRLAVVLDERDTRDSSFEACKAVAAPLMKGETTDIDRKAYTSRETG